jgi:hypothetical protein
MVYRRSPYEFSYSLTEGLKPPKNTETSLENPLFRDLREDIYISAEGRKGGILHDNQALS